MTDLSTPSKPYPCAYCEEHGMVDANPAWIRHQTRHAVQEQHDQLQLFNPDQFK